MNQPLLFARINKEYNSRGIAPYNRYFERTGNNITCLELHNPDLRILFDEIRVKKMVGAITVAFEYGPEIFELVDALDPIAERIHEVGFVTLHNGKYTGYIQGAWGLLKAVQQKTDCSDRSITLCGAGHMAHGFVAQLEVNHIKPREVNIYNRSIIHAERIANDSKFVTDIGTLDDMQKRAKGDIFINVSDIGAPWQKGDPFMFSDELVSRFDTVADIVFVPLETSLIKTAKKMNKRVSPGWETFCYGTEFVFKTMLGIEVQTSILGEELQNDFRTNWS